MSQDESACRALDELLYRFAPSATTSAEKTIDRSLTLADLDLLLELSSSRETVPTQYWQPANVLRAPTRRGMDDGLADFIESTRTARPELADELEALAAILDGLALSSHEGETVTTLVVSTTPSGSSGDGTLVKLSIEVPPSYPALPPPPRISLVSRYVGPHKVLDDTDDLAARVSSLPSSSSWSPGDAVLFELIESSREMVGEWLSRRRPAEAPVATGDRSDPPDVLEPSLKVTVVSCEPIVDRKSVFVAHAAKLNDPSEVPRIMAHLLSDRKIARAAHNIVAWRCRDARGHLHQDNDDDGETAAGSRVAHLLEILGVENVFVCVTRWYGGIHLGADRFKHINQAAREALRLGGLIPSPPPKKR